MLLSVVQFSDHRAKQQTDSPVSSLTYKSNNIFLPAAPWHCDCGKRFEGLVHWECMFATVVSEQTQK